MLTHDLARQVYRTLRTRAPRLRGLTRLTHLTAGLLARSGPLVTTAYGARFELDLLDHVDENIFWEHYEPEVLSWWMPQLGPETVFLDVGANVGLYSIIAANRGARVVAFEPNPRTRRRLERNIGLNHLSGKIAVRGEALFDEVGTTTLYDDLNVGGAGSNSGLASISKKNSVGAPIEVAMTTLDTVISELSLTRVDWLKMDIQGAEMGALRGSQKLLGTLRPRILLELDPAGAQNMGWTEADLRAFLGERGYRVRPIDSLNVVAEPITPA